MPRAGECDLAKERHWRQIIANQRASGLGIAEYCRQKEIPVSQFYDWQRTIKRRDTAASSRRRMAARAKKIAEQAKRDCAGSDLLTPVEAAAYLGVEKQTLAVWRTTGRYSLPAVKVGRLVKYRHSDLDAFLAARTFERTEPPPEADCRAVEFAQAEMVDHDSVRAPGAQPLEIVLPGGLTVRVNDGCSMELLASVISVLGGR